MRKFAFAFFTAAAMAVGLLAEETEVEELEVVEEEVASATNLAEAVEAPVSNAVGQVVASPAAIPLAQVGAEVVEVDEEDGEPTRGPEIGITDEIDLEEYDDAADAAKVPQVKAAEGDEAFDPTDEKSLINITCDDASLSDIIRQFRRTTKTNIICADSSNLQQRVSVTLNEVPWFSALQSILNSRGFRLEPRDGIYFVSEDKVENPIFTRSVKLNHASAEELANLFNETFGKKDKGGKLIGKVATAFPSANVVVISAEEKVLSDCDMILKEADQAIAQIYIEARFIELSASAMHKLGLQWDSLESWGFKLNNMKGGWENNHGKLASYGYSDNSSENTSSSSSSSTKSETGEGSVTTKESQRNTSSSITASTATFIPTIAASEGQPASVAGLSAESLNWRKTSGFGGQLSVGDFGLVMSAFEKMEDAKIFSNPKIIVSNGREAIVDMTTKRPNVTITKSWHDSGSGTETPEYSSELKVIPGTDKQMFAGEAFFSFGITLSVKPRISPDGLINVDIIPTISDQVGTVAVSGELGNEYPVIKVNRLTTNFTMNDGATAVIGGLSRTIENDIDSGIPILRKIPWIGPHLFGWKSRQKEQQEILVFVTVGVAHPENLPTDVGLPKNAVLGREYTEGSRLEPGDRPNGAASVTDIDVRPLEEQREEERAAAAERRRVMIRKAKKHAGPGK